MFLCDPNGLNLPSPSSQAGDPGNEGNLHRANHHPSLVYCNYKKLVWVGLDRLKRFQILLSEGLSRVFPELSKLVIGQKGYDSR